MTIGVQYPGDPFYMNLTSAGVPVGGLMLALQKEIARRGQFTFKYLLLPSQPADMSFTTYIQEVVPHVDVFGDNWYSDTSQRRILGQGFFRRVRDASLQLIAPNAIEPPPFQGIWTLFAPFSWGLWGIIFMIVVVTGLIHYLAVRNEGLSFTRAIYVSFGALFGGEELEPEKAPASVLNLGFTAFIM